MSVQREVHQLGPVKFETIWDFAGGNLNHSILVVADGIGTFTKNYSTQDEAWREAFKVAAKLLEGQ